MATKVNENTELAMPIRNLIGLVTAATVGTWAYFSLVERLNSIDNKIILMEADLDQNSEFRTKWPRGEMGSLPADQEQYLLLENLANQFEKLQILIESGRAPQDQQQALTLDFFEKRLTNIETQIEKLRNGRGSGN
jgi:hypothetical protein|tara:strand:- start:1199 stop:1606 length:408 start_codon:yes stop_codon:yes gene_type:complete